MSTRQQKTLYSEHEAARMLGVSIEQLRTLVKAHIFKDDDVPDEALDAFQASDLLLLKFLTGNAASTGLSPS